MCKTTVTPTSTVILIVSAPNQVQEAIHHELDGVEAHLSRPASQGMSKVAAKGRAGGVGPKYRRLDAEISAMQRNSSTYCDQPQDAADFASWLQVRYVHMSISLASRVAWPQELPGWPSILSRQSSVQM